MRYVERYDPGYMLTLEISQSDFGCTVTIDDNERYGNEYKSFPLTSSDTARKLFEDTKIAMQQFRQQLLDLGWELGDDSTERKDYCDPG